MSKSRIPRSPALSSKPVNGASHRLSIGGDQSMFLSTEEFTDIACQASAVADAVLDDIRKQKSQPTGGATEPSSGHVGVNSSGSKWCGISSVSTSVNMGSGSLRRGMGLLDIDNESVFTAGSCEGEVSGVSQQQCVEDMDSRPSNWVRSTCLEDIQSVGSQENLEISSNDYGSISSFGPSSEENVEATGASPVGIHPLNSSRMWSPRSGSICSNHPSIHPVSDRSDRMGGLVQNYSMGPSRYNQDLFPDVAVAGKLNVSHNEHESVRTADSVLGITPTAAEVELTTALKEAEGEVAELRRQVLQKNRHLEMAQAALLEYEDEVKKLCSRLQETEHKSREQGPKQTVFSELESVKSDTATLATQVSQMLDFVPAVDRYQGDGGSEIESLRIQNIEFAHQLQSYVPQEDVEQLETELFHLKTDHEKLLRELNLFKDDKKRLQSELVQAQEELMCVLSETTDADQEVKVYLQRLKACQNQEESLKRDLKRCETDLLDLQKENMQLKAEGRGWRAQTGGSRDLSVLKELYTEMSKIKSQLEEAMHENSVLKQNLEERPSPMSANPEDSKKISQLREALTVAIQVNEHMKSRLEELETELDSAQSPMVQKMNRMREMLDLALEANQLLGERVDESADVSAGLQYLQSEVHALEFDLRTKAVKEEQRWRSEMEEKNHALIECNERYVQDITEVGYPLRK